MGLTLLAAGLFVYGYFKYGTVYAAFQQLRKENYGKAEKLISKVKNPDSLTKQHKSYYHFTNGIIASEKKEWDSAYLELSKALKIGLRTKNDTSLVILNLADIEFERKKLEKAEDYLDRLKEFELKPQVKIEVTKLRKKINVAKQRV